VRPAAWELAPGKIDGYEPTEIGGEHRDWDAQTISESGCNFIPLQIGGSEAGESAAARIGFKPWRHLRTGAGCKSAAGAEHAARWRVERTGEIAGERCAPAVRAALQ
jgi:hypothetical protein